MRAIQHESRLGAAAQLRLDLLEPDPARGEERVGMEDEVRDLLDQPLVGLAGSGESRLEPLLAHLARGERRVVEQRDDVRALPAAAARAP